MDGMKEVSEIEFFAMVRKVGRIHPRPEREASFWEHQDSRKLLGVSLPGFSCQQEKKQFFVAL